MDRKVFVTGGAGGLGMCIVKRHLAMGDRVWALDMNSSPQTRELSASSENVTFIRCDITETANVVAAIGPLLAEIDRLDYLYSCAGIYRFEDKELLPNTILDDAASMYEVNAVGYLRVVQALLGVIRDGCVIMCVTSEAGSVSENWRSAEYNYCMSKAAQNMANVILYQYFSKDLGHKNTRVLCLHPGWLRTSMGGPEAFKNPDRSVAPEECADAIVDIAQDIHNIPRERMFMDYLRNDIGW